MMKIVSFLVFVLLLIFSLIFLKHDNINSVKPISNERMPFRKNVYVGAWVGGFWDNREKTLDVNVLKKFENHLDSKIALANIYSEWAFLNKSELIDVLNTLDANGWTPIISSNPSFINECQKSNLSLYETIASGSCDEFLSSVAKNLKTFNKTMFLRFAWEMNLPEMYWSVNRVGSKPIDFINAWRRFHNIVKKEQANNVLWVLSFNTSSPKTIPYKDLYPGEEFVDWVAIDGYNWGDAKDWSNWTNFDGVFKNSYNELIEVSNKPVMLSEFNSAELGGDKAVWLEEMLSVKIPYDYPRIEAIVFFNENKEKDENVDWRIEKSIRYIEGVKNALQSQSIYKYNYQ